MTVVKPTFITEAELDKRFRTKSILASGGDYGCGCAVFDGDLVDTAAGTTKLFTDQWFYALNKHHPNDVGTVLITGSVDVAGDIHVSDRLMCLVILGSLKAKSLHIRETEVWIGGPLEVDDLDDDDEYLTLGGT